MQLTRGLCVVLVGALLLTACSGSDGGASPQEEQPSASSADASPSHGASHSASEGAGALSAEALEAGAGTTSAPASPAEAALRLEALIGQHSVLASDMMRARIRADSDLAQVANAALGKNTEALAVVLEPGLGAAGRKQFEEMWAEHTEELFEYARGVATKDEEVTEHALEEIVEYEDELIVFFDGESDGRLAEAGAKGAIKEHSRHLVEAADAYAAKDYTKAAQLYRTGYGHTFDLGATLSRTLLSPDVAKAMDTPTVRLRSALTKLLGEHVALVVATMRSSVGDRADYEAMGTALNGNTVDLTKAIDTLYGAAAAKEFQARWADHVDALLAYTMAVVGGDAAAKEQAKGTLISFEGQISGFLNKATQNRLGQKALTDVFVMHDKVLLEEIDAFAAKDFQQATDLSYRVYEDMFTVSGQLSTAIGSSVAAKLPKGGSQTGGGGTAGSG